MSLAWLVSSLLSFCLVLRPSYSAPCRDYPFNWLPNRLRTRFHGEVLIPHAPNMSSFERIRSSKSRQWQKTPSHLPILTNRPAPSIHSHFHLFLGDSHPVQHNFLSLKNIRWKTEKQDGCGIAERGRSIPTTDSDVYNQVVCYHSIKMI